MVILYKNRAQARSQGLSLCYTVPLKNECHILCYPRAYVLVRKSNIFTTSHNRRHFQLRPKPEVCATGTWRFWVITEGPWKGRSLSCTRDVEKEHTSQRYSKMSKSSGVEKTKLLNVKIWIPVGMKQ